MNLELTNSELLLIKKLINKEINKGEQEKDGNYTWNGTKYVKPRAKYGIGTMETLYGLSNKLKTTKK